MRGLAVSVPLAFPLLAALSVVSCSDDERARAASAATSGASSGAGADGEGGNGQGSTTAGGTPGSSSSTGEGASGPGGTGGATSAGAGGSTTSSGSGGGGQPAAPIDCTTCGAVSSAGTVASALIDELSGLAASRLHGGILYGHNDSGDEPRFFAFDLAGAERGLFTVTAATARDWEDMAAGPCGDGLPGCLYFSDMGDNGEARDDLVLYRVAEPAQLGAGVVANLAVEAFPFSYPDGPHNAEAVMVHPVSGVVTIVTKGAAAAIFELRPPLAGDMVAVRIADYAAPASIVTGADVDAAGRTVAIRSYAGVYLYPMRPEQSVAEALAGASCTAPVAVEGQGEAVTFLFGSPGYVTASEGAAPVLHRVDCR